MNNTLKFATLLAAAAAFAAPAAHALDGKVVLDQMVKKGMITPEEADAILQKDAARQADKPAMISAKQVDARQVTISGRVQLQGKYFVRDNKTNAPGVPSDAGETPDFGFELRRLNLDFNAELVQNLSLFGSIEANSGNIAGQPTFFIDKAGVRFADKDAGIFVAGVQKTRFGLEEYTSASEIFTIERSAVSNYFSGGPQNATGIGLGARHAGLFWENKEVKTIEKDGGLRIGASVNNVYQNNYTNTTTPQGESYAPGFFLSTDYGVKLDDKTMLTFGANLAYTEANINQLGAGNGTTTGLGGNINTNANFDTRTIGLELVSKLKSGNLTVIGDFMAAQIENGKFAAAPSPVANTRSADGVMPWGATLTMAYRLTEKIEPIMQLGYVDTEGRGIADSTFRDFPNNGSTASPTAGVTGTTYDRATTIFLGSAYYVTPKSLKITAGLEAVRFEGQPNGTARPVGADERRTDAIGGRIQVQALF